jgi:cell division septation protein DedD
MRPMIMRTERRHNSRMAVEGLAYVNLQPDSGGVVLNISEGGLCFHSSTPVEKPTNIRFWFAQRGLRGDGPAGLGDSTQMKSGSRFIEAECELLWTDEDRKIGGLRFTTMSPEGREQIREWIRQREMQSTLGQKPTLATAPTIETRSPKTAFLQAKRAGVSREAAVSGDSSATVAPARLQLGFIGGLLAGLGGSAVLVAAFLLGAHNRELGQSLVRAGQRFGGTLPADAAKAKSVLPDTLDVASLPAATSFAAAKDSSASATKSVAKDEEVPVAVEAPAHSAIKLSAKAPRTPHRSALNSPVPPALESDPNALTRDMPKIESASKPAVQIEPSIETGRGFVAEKFLEVGSFSNRAWIDRTTDKLTRLGFHSAVVPKGSLWKKSYRVLVGPFASDQEAESAHKHLTASGFSPRSFERGRRDFTFRTPLRLNGARVPVGECVVSWESYLPDAIVKIEDYRGIGMTAEGKWVSHGVHYEHDAVVYRVRPDGARTLSELQFSGKGQALVFDKVDQIEAVQR